MKRKAKSEKRKNVTLIAVVKSKYTKAVSFFSEIARKNSHTLAYTHRKAHVQ